jgi:hypothetical protein
VKDPSSRGPLAFVPLVLSLAALALVLGHAGVYRITPEPDEGAAAHIFQLLMLAQLPIVAYFALTWFRRSPVRTLLILSLRAAAAPAAIAAVYWLTRAATTGPMYQCCGEWSAALTV